MAKSKLKIIPIGGLGEIGKNMMLMQYEDDIIVIDAGLMFPVEEMLGVDLVIPDISYLVENKEKIRGIIVTHGHEDHIGAMTYVLPQLNVPVYSTKLTNGLISVKLKEHKALANADLRIVPPGGKITLGKFRVEFFPVCHSIPDAVGFIITTPVGTVVHTGDFKLDYTPVSGKPTDLSQAGASRQSGSFIVTLRFHLCGTAGLHPFGKNRRGISGPDYGRSPGQSDCGYIFVIDFTHPAGHRCCRQT
jgi:ribonuclease J